MKTTQAINMYRLCSNFLLFIFVLCKECRSQTQLKTQAELGCNIKADITVYQNTRLNACDGIRNGLIGICNIMFSLAKSGEY
ncbi:hypothetical protein D3C72_2150760 [compost metagenome]